MPHSLNTIKTGKGSVTLVEQGIIRYQLKENTEWTLKEAKECHAANLRLSEGERYFTYMKAKKFFIPTKEAQQFIASKECTKHRIAAVLVVENKGLQLLATLFIRLFQSKSPSYIFKTEAEAMKWMRAEYKKHSEK